MKLIVLKRMASVYAYTAVAVSVLFLLYMNLPYWYDRYQTELTLAPFIFLAVIMTAVVMFLQDIRLGLAFFRTPYAKWCVAVMVIHLLNIVRVHVLDFPDYVRTESIDRAQLFTLAPAIAYLLYRVPSKYFARLIGVIAFLCPITLIANFAMPELFATANPMPGEDSNRIAGFWLNPNIAGEMVVMAMLMAYPHVNRNVFTVIIIVSAVGILLTASRSGAIAWLFIVLPLLATRRIPLWLIGVILAAALSFQSVVDYFDNLAYDAGREGTGLVILDRVDDQLEGSEDSSTESRLEVVTVALQESLEHAFIGHGYNYDDIVWEVGTHNMVVAWVYLYGAVGLALWAYLAYSLFRRTLNRQDLLLPFAVFVWYSLFSHNIMQLSQWFIFFGWVFWVNPVRQAQSRSRSPSPANRSKTPIPARSTANDPPVTWPSRRRRKRKTSFRF